MPNYVEYLTDDGLTVLIEVDETNGGIVNASRGGISVVETGKKFADAFASVRGSLRSIVVEFDALKIDEAEVKFGLKAVGEAGVFAVGKVGGEMNYEVTLKWKKPGNSEKEKAQE